ncbi:MAG: 5-oxoprolinase subunit PxpB [Opitutaceae bacterium]
MTILPLGDSAVVIDLGENTGPAIAARARAIADQIVRRRPAWVIDVVPAFASVAVHYDPLRAPEFEMLQIEVAELAALEGSAASVAPKTVAIPVVYGGDAGPDLAGVAQHAGLSRAEVIARHSAVVYEVSAIGFSPGFPYLGGLPPELATPRRPTPRTSVPAGSVGIGGAQTGIYPRESPGGWNLIGRTPLALFDPHRSAPAYLHAGDRVMFHPVAAAEFQSAAKASAAVHNDASTAAIEVARPGVFTTVQDLGRPGHRAQGVALGGAADALALRVANLLVGNAETEAALEFTLAGPELIFRRDALVAVCGAEIDGVPEGRPMPIRAGQTLDLGRLRHGCRGYLAVAGGIDVPIVLGSRGTDVRGGFGGWAGRALHAGDCLSVPDFHRDPGEHWHIDRRIFPPPGPPVFLRVVAGRHTDDFDAVWLAHEFKASPQSDRMGVRLSGATMLRRTARELISAPVTPGTVQVPPDGRPIVLLADAQTIGGYPRLAHVITVDLARAAQLRPGDSVRFTMVPLAEARRLLREREHRLDLLRAGLAQKLH